MRQPNYKLGWYIPNQVAALTHFHPDVTQEDFMGVFQTGQELFTNLQNEVHVIIDNRLVNMSAPATLTDMKTAVPFMNHPLLRWVVVVKPTHLTLDTNNLPVEQSGQKQLKNVSTLKEAFHFLKQETEGLSWQDADPDFFPNQLDSE